MLKVQNLNKKFGTLNVINDFSFQVDDGEIVAITGPSGCGKTTLLNIISGLIPPDSGSIQNSEKKVSYVFQEDRLLPWLTVWDNIKLVNDKQNPREIQRLINSVGLNGFEKYMPGRLSGGMKQRCAIARALNYGSKILLLDEPFKGLDQEIKTKILLDIKKINQEHKISILLVTHDLSEAEQLNARIIKLV